jgi:hypothetical protein
MKLSKPEILIFSIFLQSHQKLVEKFLLNKTSRGIIEEGKEKVIKKLKELFDKNQISCPDTCLNDIVKGELNFTLDNLNGNNNSSSNNNNSIKNQHDADVNMFNAFSNISGDINEFL